MARLLLPMARLLLKAASSVQHCPATRTWACSCCL
jgi:hypothetical protein